MIEPFMNIFPSLQIWFRFASSSEIPWGTTSVLTNGQYIFNDCTFFTLLWRDDADKNSFVRELAKLIARIRSNSAVQEGWASDFCAFVDSQQSVWSYTNKENFRIAVLSNWLRNASWTINEDWIKGHIGEILYFLVQKQFSFFNTILSSPENPKRRSTDPWNDVVQLCLWDDGNIFIVFSEIKTTHKTIGSLHSDIIEQLNTRISVNYSDNLEEFKRLLEIKNDFLINNYDSSFRTQIEHFLLYEMDEICLMSSNSNSRKQMLGMINYGKEKIHANTTFKDINSKLDPTFSRDIDKKRVVLIWIKDIGSIVDSTYDLLFNS